MLHILLMLLKIIGILILLILGIILLVLGIVLLVPVRYVGTTSIKGGLDSVKFQFKCSWLMHLVSGWVNYEGKKPMWQVRILHKKFDSTRQAEETPSEVLEETISEEVTEESVTEEIENIESVEEPNLEEAEPTTSKKSGSKKKKRSILDKIKYTIRNICDKIKMLKQKKDEIVNILQNEIYQSSVRKALKELGKLLKALRPKKLQINAHFGFEDPSLTGKILALLSMLYPFYGDNIKIQPDFEEAVLEGDLYVKGRMRVVHAARMFWNLVWDKHVRVTFKDIMKLGKKS